MEPGDLYWVQLPPAGGHEQTGRRPALILQSDAYAGSLPTVIVLPLTSAMASSRFAGTLRLESTTENGLRAPSVALAFQIRAVDRRRIQEKIGSIGMEALAEIFETLDHLMGRVQNDKPTT